MMTEKKKGDFVKVGDKFDAYIKKGPFSKTLGGIEKAGCPASNNPGTAIKVTDLQVETEAAVYLRTRFWFKKIGE